jgi:hypothetical protein
MQSAEAAVLCEHGMAKESLQGVRRKVYVSMVGRRV